MPLLVCKGHEQSPSLERERKPTPGQDPSQGWPAFLLLFTFRSLVLAIVGLGDFQDYYYEMKIVMIKYFPQSL